MNTKNRGTASVGVVLSVFLKYGYSVLLPLGDNERYDLVVDGGGKFSRIQVKTGRLKSGAVEFDLSSTNLEKGKWVRHDYSGQIEYFAVYCPELDKMYLVPVKPGVSARLRVEEPKNNARKNIVWAKDFEFKGL